MGPADYRALLIALDLDHDEVDQFLLVEAGTSARYAAPGSDGPPAEVERLLRWMLSSGACGDDVREALRRDP